MKTILLLVAILTFSINSAQEIEKVEKIKIGKFEYEICLDFSYNLERNFDILSFSIKFHNKKQKLGTYLVYRATNSSKKYEKKVADSHPPDPRLFLKDGIILSEGKINIDGKNNKITILERNVHKDKGFDNDPDSIKRIYKQKNNGLFELILLSEYNNDVEKIILKK